MARCELCKETIPDQEILEHLRLLHPEEYGDGPDGGDECPEPGDFDP